MLEILPEVRQQLRAPQPFRRRLHVILRLERGLDGGKLDRIRHSCLGHQRRDGTLEVERCPVDLVEEGVARNVGGAVLRTEASVRARG